MSDYKAVFKRVEIKYLLDRDARQAIMEAAEGHMALDEYGRTEIRSIYFDTPTFLLARRSNEHPLYKEKLRVRSYGPAGPGDDVFVELKKKYDGIVYKRRVTTSRDRAMAWLTQREEPGIGSQIQNEIDFFLDRYEGLGPAMLLSYEREAYKSVDGGDLRLTIDDTILARTEDMDLGGRSYGTKVIGDDASLMELKISGAIPLWLVRAMTENGIFKSSFSKYGTAYKMIVMGMERPEPVRRRPGIGDYTNMSA